MLTLDHNYIIICNTQKRAWFWPSLGVTYIALPFIEREPIFISTCHHFLRWRFSSAWLAPPSFLLCPTLCPLAGSRGLGGSGRLPAGIGPCCDCVCVCVCVCVCGVYVCVCVCVLRRKVGEYDLFPSRWNPFTALHNRDQKQIMAVGQR